MIVNALLRYHQLAKGDALHQALHANFQASRTQTNHALRQAMPVALP